MKKIFQNFIEAIDRFVTSVEKEGQIEALIERLKFNNIYYEKLFLNIDLKEAMTKVHILKNKGP